MRVLLSLGIGFMVGCFYSMWELVEVDEGIVYKIIGAIKSVVEVL